MLRSFSSTYNYQGTGAGIDHNLLNNLTVGDVHTQYAFLAGRAGGQSLNGGTASGNSLTFQSTSNATKGSINFGTAGAFGSVSSAGVWSLGGSAFDADTIIHHVYGGFTVSTNAITLNTFPFKLESSLAGSVGLNNYNVGTGNSSSSYVLSQSGLTRPFYISRFSTTHATVSEIVYIVNEVAKDIEIYTNNLLRLSIGGAGEISAGTLGKGFSVKEGSNARMGISTLVGGTVSVSTTAVGANSRIFLTTNTVGGTVGALSVSARTAGTSFAITSTSGADTSSVAWIIFDQS